MKYADCHQTRKARVDNYSIIVHSHLRWDWVWQRPQQFLSRLSKNHRILFIEAPYPFGSGTHGAAQLCAKFPIIRTSCVANANARLALELMEPGLIKSVVVSCNRFSLVRLAGISIRPCNGFMIRWLLLHSPVI